MTQSLQGVHMRSCMRSLFICVGAHYWSSFWFSNKQHYLSLCVGAQRWGGVQLVYTEHLSVGMGGLFLTEGDIGVLSRVFFIFDAGHQWECTCLYVWCIHTHTLTLHMKWWMWAQGSWQDTWRARRVQMDWISAYMYSYMCTKYTCVYICWGMMMIAFITYKK